MDPKRCVFVSHCSEDRTIAQAISDRLEAASLACWIAPRDVPPGQRYAKAIIEAIEECRVFLLVYSANADESPHVRNEIEKAASRDVPILLIRTDSTQPDRNKEISLFLSSHQWFDASTGSLDTHLDRLVADVRRLVMASNDVDAESSSTTVIDTGDRQVKSGGSKSESGLTVRWSIGIDVGATKIRGYARNLDVPDGSSPRQDSYLDAIRRPVSARSLLDQVRKLIDRIIEDEELSRSPPVGIGIAVPGQVDVRAGTLKFGPGLGLHNVPFRTALASAYPGVPIRIDNDARCATRCELHIGVGREFDSFVCIFVGTGVGSGFVVNRRIHFGQNYCAGEIGHMKISSNGPPCACGQVGCLETFVKGPAIAALARAKAIDWKSRGLATRLSDCHEELDAKFVARMLEEGDEAAREVVDEVGEKLGLGIANCLNLINPGTVVLGGGVMAGFFLHMVERISHSIQRNAIAEVANTPIVQSQYTEEAAAIGAALLFHPEEEWPF